MKKIILCLLLCLFVSKLFSIPIDLDSRFEQSTPEQISALRSSAGDLVGGIVCPLSGQPMLRQIDLIARGAQDISLKRIYLATTIPGQFSNCQQTQDELNKYSLAHLLRYFYRGWIFLPHSKLKVYPDHNDFFFTTSYGGTFQFKIPKENNSKAELIQVPFGINNTSEDTPSAQFDVRNTLFSFNKDEVIIKPPDGTTLIFSKELFDEKLKPGAVLFLLKKEILPNGKILKYYYKNFGSSHGSNFHSCWQLSRIESLDPTEQIVYAYINITGSPWNEICKFSTSSSGSSKFKFKINPYKGTVINGNVTTSFDLSSPPFLTECSTPILRDEKIEYLNNSLLSSYSGKNQTFKVTYKKVGNPEKVLKIDKLFFPSEKEDSYDPLYDFEYDAPKPGEKGGKTVVKCKDGTSKIYHFSEKMLKTKVQYFSSLQKLSKVKIYEWDSNHRLKSLEIKNGAGEIELKTAYKYDKYGNPILEVLTGRFTGENNLDTYYIKRVFSNDNRNLLLSEEHENGKKILFTYLPNTNLVTSKIVLDHETIILRDFIEYDKYHNIIRKISDDGQQQDKKDLSGVTQRHITSYTLRQKEPFLHLPDCVEEKYWDGHSEKLLTKKHLFYDQYGHLSKVDVYDACEEFAYSTSKTFNERGDVLSETNKLGQKAEYEYNKIGLLTKKINFSNRVTSEYTYDSNRQLIKKTELGDNGVKHTTSYEYDPFGRLLKETDPYGNSTTYTHRLWGNNVIETKCPSIPYFDDAHTVVQKKSTFDPFGNELIRGDGNGYSTHMTYNSHGRPTSIVHKNGGKEFFTYNKIGELIGHTKINNLKVTYTRDILGRITSKLYSSKENLPLAKEIFKYNAYNLIAESNKEGRITEYFYDRAGRKIKEVSNDRVTQYYYDSQNRLEKTVKFNNGNSLATHYRRNLDGQIIEEIKLDTSGNILHKIGYQYDLDGNVSAVERQVNNQTTFEFFQYDPFGRLLTHETPNGAITYKTYNEDFHNNLGQRTLQTTTINPEGISTLETHDAMGNLSERKSIDQEGYTVSKQTFTHDANGNVLFQKDYRYLGRQLLDIQTIKFDYTPNNQIQTIIQGYKTHLPKQTSFSYFPSGLLQSKILPNETTIEYKYDPFEYIESISSSDGSIFYEFKRNKLGQIYRAIDKSNNRVIERQLDSFGNILEEKFPSGVSIYKTYDKFDRPTSLQIPSLGKVLYSYNPFSLKKVSRLSSNGKLLYEHAYEEYDNGGHLVLESLIGDIGSTHYELNSSGEVTQKIGPHFSELLQYNLLGNLTEKSVSEVVDFYQYDPLSQLVAETGSANLTYNYDSLYNRIKKNDSVNEVNEQNELLLSEDILCSYDKNGNLISKNSPTGSVDYTYDAFNRLTEVYYNNNKIIFTYDPFDRCLSKEHYQTDPLQDRPLYWKENYLYDGYHEIGTYSDSGKFESFRVFGIEKFPSMPSCIAIELKDKTFAPIVDNQGNIRKLIDIHSKMVTHKYEYTSFGELLELEELSYPNLWRFASKRFDPNLNLVNFGKRYYDPKFARWVTPDPGGFIDSVNLYQYAFNNPYQFYDPYGESLCGFLLGLLQVVRGIMTITTGSFTPTGFMAITAGLSSVINGVQMVFEESKDLSPISNDWGALFDSIHIIFDPFLKKEDSQPNRPNFVNENKMLLP